jgi:hypothetical protein
LKYRPTDVPNKLLIFGGACCSRGRDGKSYRVVSVGKPEGKRLLGRPRRRWKDNIKMNLRETA